MGTNTRSTCHQRLSRPGAPACGYSECHMCQPRCPWFFSHVPSSPVKKYMCMVTHMHTFPHSFCRCGCQFPYSNHPSQEGQKRASQHTVLGTPGRHSSSFTFHRFLVIFKMEGEKNSLIWLFWMLTFLNNIVQDRVFQNSIQKSIFLNLINSLFKCFKICSQSITLLWVAQRAIRSGSYSFNLPVSTFLLLLKSVLIS